jgi:hypothetical protein
MPWWRNRLARAAFIIRITARLWVRVPPMALIFFLSILVFFRLFTFAYGGDSTMLLLPPRLPSQIPALVMSQEVVATEIAIPCSQFLILSPAITVAQTKYLFQACPSNDGSGSLLSSKHVSVIPIEWILLGNPPEKLIWGCSKNAGYGETSKRTSYSPNVPHCFPASIWNSL